MKFIYLAFLIITVLSCRDIIDSGSYISKEQVYLPSKSIDSLSYLVLKPVDLGKIKKNRIVNSLLTISNSSMRDTINIYNIQFLNQVGIEVTPIIGYPVIIPPNSTNSGSPVLIRFNTNNYPIGNYEDFIIINNNNNYKIKVTAQIY